MQVTSRKKKWQGMLFNVFKSVEGTNENTGGGSGIEETLSIGLKSSSEDSQSGLSELDTNEHMASRANLNIRREMAPHRSPFVRAKSKSLFRS